jgi:multimeric flavodoxin WrbA
MKVLIITGSAHKNGTTAYLTERFIKGAEEAGHEIYRFDAAFKDVHPCIACEKCHNGTLGCVFKDDMQELNPHLIEADAIVLVSPIYYYGFSAQLKAVIDRFYANDAVLHGSKKAVLMVTMADDNIETANGALETFKGMAKYLEWNIAGTVVGVNCMTPDMLKATDYPQQAYELGKAL